MTKTLTEQWKDGKLLRGLYYVRSTSGRECVCIHSGSQSFMFSSNDKYACQVKEVLAPVPSYTELTLMAGNYRLAKKALRDCYNEMKYWATMNHRCSKIFNHIKEALVEIEEVK